MFGVLLVEFCQICSLHCVGRASDSRNYLPQSCDTDKTGTLAATLIIMRPAGGAFEDANLPAAIDDGNIIDQSGRGAADNTVKVQQHTRPAPGGPLEPSNSSRSVGQQSTVPAGATVGPMSVDAAAVAGNEAAAVAAMGILGIGLNGKRPAAGYGQPGVDTVTADAAANAAAGYPGYPSAAAAAAVAAGRPVERDHISRSAVLQLIWHPSDSAVKPIVANRRIERLPEVQYDGNSLPFEPLNLQQMLDSDQQELEGFLTHIYRTIASSAPVKDKVNVLNYFESLCSDTAAANVLINSSLTVLFVRMLRNGKMPLLRIRLASVLGLLVRHATYIADELAGTQLVEILTEALKDKQERVRRRWVGSVHTVMLHLRLYTELMSSLGLHLSRVLAETQVLCLETRRPNQQQFLAAYTAAIEHMLDCQVIRQFHSFIHASVQDASFALQYSLTCPLYQTMFQQSAVDCCCMQSDGNSWRASLLHCHSAARQRSCQCS